eukprot:TRINITY_DN51458_c0_g1_i1.p1 TRINITY_DN51458_c0_g1~~TRINITY_DN51458_c0_g1_i1.p1  ORF type:complete len:295 (+),score=33.65 TRINITY_DN51458_c0_g1_i1:603-1487(+)
MQESIHVVKQVVARTTGKLAESMEFSVNGDLIKTGLSTSLVLETMAVNREVLLMMIERDTIPGLDEAKEVLQALEAKREERESGSTLIADDETLQEVSTVTATLKRLASLRFGHGCHDLQKQCFDFALRCLTLRLPHFEGNTGFAQLFEGLCYPKELKESAWKALPTFTKPGNREVIGLIFDWLVLLRNHDCVGARDNYWFGLKACLKAIPKLVEASSGAAASIKRKLQAYGCSLIRAGRDETVDLCCETIQELGGLKDKNWHSMWYSNYGWTKGDWDTDAEELEPWMEDYIKH